LYAACCMRTTSRRVLWEPTSPDSRARIRCLYVAAIGLHEQPCQQDRVACELPHRAATAEKYSHAHTQALAEMKEKIGIVDNETEILRNENLAKEKALAKEKVSTVQRTPCNVHGEPPPKREQHRSRRERSCGRSGAAGPCLADVLGLVTPQHCDEVKGCCQCDHCGL